MPFSQVLSRHLANLNDMWTFVHTSKFHLKFHANFDVNMQIFMRTFIQTLVWVSFHANIHVSFHAIIILLYLPDVMVLHKNFVQDVKMMDKKLIMDA